MIEAAAICILSLLASAALTGVIRKFALSRGVLDVPNERSSHTVATPRGGGAAVVLVVTAAATIFCVVGVLQPRLFAAVAGGGVLVALVGFLDDRHSVSAGTRFAVHVMVALWAVFVLGGLPPLRILDQVVDLGWGGYVLAVLGIVWTLNLFNFMDGIDGIAASEAVFAALAGAWLTFRSPSELTPLALTFAAASAGFLLWNWPPAKIFMGDVGSGFVGYVIAVMALAAARENSAAVWIWLILGGAFFVDATVTLIRRAIGGQKVYAAHRSHAYQWLARRWRSHLKVTVAVALVNVLWLLPCALLATWFPQRALWIVGVALTPLVVAALAAGSGKSESDPA